MKSSPSRRKLPMFYCDACGLPVPGGDEVCPHCGSRFNGVRCPSCGHSGREQDFRKGCPVCGHLAESSGTGAERNSVPRKPAPSPGMQVPGWFYSLGIALLLSVLGVIVYLLYVRLK